MNKEQVQLIASTLQFELDEPERARAIENATHVFVDSPAAARLLTAVQRGDWPRATALAAGVLPGPQLDAAVLEIESCHVLETLLASGGAEAMRVIKTAARPEHAAQLGLLLFRPPAPPGELRQRLHNRLRHMLGPQHTVPSGRLAALLRAALQFRCLDETGQASAELQDAESVDNAVARAYVLETVTSLSLGAPPSALADLAALCDVSEYLNLFGIDAVSDAVRTVMQCALQEDGDTAIRLMRARNSTGSDLIERLFGSLVAAAEQEEAAPLGYEYLKRYEEHRTPDLPRCDTVLQLGQVVEAVLNKHTTRIPQQSLFVPVSDEPAQFPSHIVQKLRLDSEVWVVEFSPDGTNLAIGCADGNVLLYHVDLDAFKFTRASSIRLDNGVHRIAWHPSGSRLLVEDLDGIDVVWDVKTDSKTPILLHHDADTSLSSSNGDVCWHPTRPDLFFRVGWDQTLSLRDANGEGVNWWCTLGGEPLQCVTPTADKKLAVLTTYTEAAPQRLFVFDNYDAPTTVDEFVLPSGEGRYSSLQASAWDPRTLLLMGSNRAVLLLDITGKRDVVSLKGPLQDACFIRPRFAGPMDKYVMSGSEEKPPTAWVFNRFTGDVVARFQDHRESVNSVSMYSGEKQTLLATGSDDMDVIIYSSACASADEASVTAALPDDLHDDGNNSDDNDNDIMSDKLATALSNGRR